MDKPLIEIIFMDDFTDIKDFLEKLDEDKVYITVEEWIPDFTKDSEDDFIFLGEPFLITKNSNPWLIFNYIRDQIGKTKFPEIQDNSICLIRFQQLNIS